MSYDKGLKRVQEINRTIMRKLHEVCKKYDITYFLDSGALIGAVRHKSFIPWDDDIDVAFPRKEFEKLLKVPKEEWGDDFELVPSIKLSPKGFLDFTVRLIDLKETVKLKSYDKAIHACDPKYHNKMGIDCFVLDNAYDSKWKQFILRLRLTLIYGQGMGHRDYIDYSEYSLVQKAVIFIMSTIGKHRELEQIYNVYNRISQSAPENTQHYFYSNYTISYLWVWVEKEWYSEAVSVQIDNDWFDAPKGYHEVLTTVYGDYMQLPSEKERIPIHILED